MAQGVRERINKEIHDAVEQKKPGWDITNLQPRFIKLDGPRFLVNADSARFNLDGSMLSYTSQAQTLSDRWEAPTVYFGSTAHYWNAYFLVILPSDDDALIFQLTHLSE